MTREPPVIKGVQPGPERVVPKLPAQVRRPDPLRVEPTPLHMKTSAACQTNDWTAWAGYTVPNTCSSLKREMEALDKRVVMADLSPMGRYAVSGPDASRYLNHLLVVNVDKIMRGESVLSPMCQSNGKVINLITLARISDSIWWLTCDGRHMNWFEQSAIGFDVTLDDCSVSHAGLMLVGPQAADVLIAADLGDCLDLLAKGARYIVFDGLNITLVHRSGESVPGLSIWCEARQAPILWNRLMDAGEAFGIEPVGHMACEALRIESGLPAAGHDFVVDPEALRGDRSRSAIELGFDDILAFDKGVFNGRAALLEERARGSKLRLATLGFHGPAPQPGAHLHKKEGRKDSIVGVATSTTPAPHRTGAKGLGFVVVDHVAMGDTVEVVIEETRELLHVSRKAPCTVLTTAK